MLYHASSKRVIIKYRLHKIKNYNKSKNASKHWKRFLS
ncbi:hypothetical protein RA0C_1128 [Riemerella anatipestifer ATCC 11845 = DSM 15868]|uniref:Uncharacterized protein n=1 Tax=Riemerella anatipestifer (strain ATCC 11845 / DSM 15868 / JCM 9532 / NCTC 11014) TaxID=693978 RepID=H8MA99_RIEAD|nr:hypothetical protein RA0C_1128 [Riemerella anatipestifer ATCC 11845 = DSM 15868]